MLSATDKDPARANPAAGGGACAVVIVTGMSGAGRTLALKAFEDLGYETVDNLPLILLPNLVRGESGGRPLAIGIDIRTRDFGVEPMLHGIDRMVADCGKAARLLFIDCDDDVLCRRYTETRHRHPLAIDRPLLDGIELERRLIAPLRSRADVVVDTSQLPPGQLKRLIGGHFSPSRNPGLVVFVTSFSFRRGLPREAHYDPDLRPLTGREAQVVEHVAADPDFAQFFDRLTGLLEPLMPRYAAEGKTYLTIAIGCTGGRHRSVVVAERLTQWLRGQGQRVELRHRELEDGGAVT